MTFTNKLSYFSLTVLQLSTFPLVNRKIHKHAWTINAEFYLEQLGCFWNSDFVVGFRADLQRAIEGEDYSGAARIRDQISKLEVHQWSTEWNVFEMRICYVIHCIWTLLMNSLFLFLILTILYFHCVSTSLRFIWPIFDSHFSRAI